MSEKPISPLRRRMIEDMMVRNFIEKTRNDYIRHVLSLTAFLRRSPDTATPEDLRRFQLHQTQTGVRAPSINASVAGIRFFFTVTLDRPDMARHLTFVREPRKIPAVLSSDEVVHLLEAAPGPKYKAALGVAYGAGLRVSEVVSLKISDVDSKRMLLKVGAQGSSCDAVAAAARAVTRLVSHRAATGLAVSRPRPNQSSDTSPAQPRCACRRPYGRDQEARDAAYPQAQFRHALARTECRHPRDPNPPGSRQTRYHCALHPRRHQHDPCGHQSTRPVGAAAAQQSSAAAVTGDTRGPFCSRGRGHLPRPRSRLARCQRWPREPWSAEGDERHRELPHRGSRWARRTLRGLCTHHDRYNSCRDRHCPKCQAAAAREWLEAREAELLPVPYFHLVFTLPSSIVDIAYQNKAVVYDILFKAAAETMLTIAADPRHLGANIAITAVLHTWGSAMTQNPHS